MRDSSGMVVSLVDSSGNSPWRASCRRSLTAIQAVLTTGGRENKWCRSNKDYPTGFLPAKYTGSSCETQARLGITPFRRTAWWVKIGLGRLWAVLGLLKWTETNELNLSVLPRWTVWEFAMFRRPGFRFRWRFSFQYPG